jgi:hypothetical protein
MDSDDEINYNITRLRFEHLLSFFRNYEYQDEFNYAIRLLVLGLLYNGAQDIIDNLSVNLDRVLLASKQTTYATEFQDLIGAISSLSNLKINVTGGTNANPSIQNFGIQGLDASELNNHFQLWKNSLERTSHDLELVETIDLLEHDLFSGFQDIPPVAPENFILMPSTRQAHQLRMALATGNFTFSREDLCARADLNGDSTVQIFALLQPQVARKKRVLPDHEEAILRDKMVELVGRMTDLTVDVFDIICNALLKNGDADGIDALAVEEILEQRGLTKHKSGNGRRGGYKPEQRQAIDQHREILNHLYLNSHYLKKYKGNAGSGSQSSAPWNACEELFGMKNQVRQTALLSQQALQYDPYRQKWEKRLTRYLAWLWRIRKYAKECKEPIAVKVLLLNAVGRSMDRNNPARTRRRLEKALDRLRSDEVIRNWNYASANDNWAGREGWQKSWFNQKITVAPPALIIEHYKNIKEAITLPKAKKTIALQ